MKMIYECRFSEREYGDIQLPEGAEILTIQYQNGCLYLWAKVDTTKSLVNRHIEVFRTGYEILEDMKYKYITTIQYSGYVWHYFERLNHE